jgi:hypothetical protein
LAWGDCVHRLTVEHGVGKKAFRHLHVDLVVALPGRTRAAKLSPGGFVE